MSNPPKPLRPHRRHEADPDAAEERELILRSRRGDQEAFEMIVTRYRDQVFAVAYRYTGDPETALDLSQDAFVKAWTKLASFDPSRAFRPWILRIARNISIDHTRRVGTRREVSLDHLAEEHHLQFDHAERNASGGSAPSAQDPRANLYREEIGGHLSEALAQISPAHREVIMLFHEQELTYQEIADTLNVPVGTVMSRLFNARKALGIAMKRRMGDEEALR